MGRPIHVPTEITRNTVSTLAGVGLNHKMIAVYLGIADKTLLKHYRTELDLGKAKACANVAKSLYQRAIGGDTTAMIFWCKTQMGWRDVSTHEISGREGEPIQHANVRLTKEEIAEAVARVQENY